MLRQPAVLIIPALLTLTEPVRSAIVYSVGPSFAVPAFEGFKEIDINADGIPDYSFWSTGAIGTFALSSGSLFWPFNFGASGSNMFLTRDYALVQALTTSIDANPPAGSDWSRPSASSLLTSRRDGILPGHWDGTLGNLGIGYLGVRFHTPDGLHFGWIRVRLPRPPPEDPPLGSPFEVAPVVVDWAYKTKPDTAIRAGVIEPAGKSTQFTVDFRDKADRPAPPGSVGTFILTDSTLRGELVLNGWFRFAELRGPASVPSKAKPVASFGQPLLSREDYTAFFAEMALSRSEVIHLLRGALHVSVDGGLITGRIVPK